MEKGDENQEGRKSQINLAAEFQQMQQLKPTIALFVKLLDENFHGKIRLNEMTGRPEWLNPETKVWNQWTDVEDAKISLFFQNCYFLYSPKMLEAAIMVYLNTNRKNPLIDLIESLEWDGTPRIENFLHFAIHCDDTAYSREVSRLIFAGGIHRAYRPGCKFDDMVVLIGKQGGGKSTLVRWLNMEDQYFREIKTISGKEGIEALRGVWIGEVAELMAMTRLKEAEAVKAYITAQEDSYRAPYNRHVETIPRRCTFIGTTNTPQFLSDKTGNRRFYPIKCAEDGYDLFDREEEVKEYIRQCWAEARTLYKQDKLPPYANRELLEVIRKAQADAEEDDWRVGAIQQYLEDTKKDPNSQTCVIELWHNALGEPEESKPGRSDSIEIAKIMNEMPGWERTGNSIMVLPWGKQKVYRKSAARFFPFWND